MKEFKNQDNKLYLSVCLKNKMEAGRLAEDADKVGLTSAAPTASNISIYKILQNVNPEYGDFLKYFPDSMLSEEQIEAKNVELVKEEEYLESIRKDGSPPKSDTAQMYIDAATDVHFPNKAAAQSRIVAMSFCEPRSCKSLLSS